MRRTADPIAFGQSFAESESVGRGRAGAGAGCWGRCSRCRSEESDEHRETRHETDAEWEIVSVNGHPTNEPAPIAPNTLMHNHFGSDGGSNTNMTAEEFEAAMRESFEYWKNKGMMQ